MNLTATARPAAVRNSRLLVAEAGNGWAQAAFRYSASVSTQPMSCRAPELTSFSGRLAADTAFGLSVLGAWCRQTPRANLVLSPSSLASGLGMAYLGAGSATAQAMARVLHLPATGPRLAAQLQARSAALRSLDRPGVTVASSDQVWTDPGLITRRSYLNAVATGCYIGAGLGPGPRDGLITGIAARGHSLRLVRTLIELSVLAAGAVLGGTVGVGTLAYALAIGPLTHLLLPRLAMQR